MDLRIPVTGAGPDGRQVSLSDILGSLGSRALTSLWKVEGIEGQGGEGAERLMNLSYPTCDVKGAELLSYARDFIQTWEGSLSASDSTGSDPWVVIDILDGLDFSVSSSDQRLLQNLKSCFPLAWFDEDLD